MDFNKNEFDLASQAYSNKNLSHKYPLLSSRTGTSFLENLCEKWRSGKFCDVKLYPGIAGLKESNAEPTTTSSVLAHKIVIDYVSPYFNHVFRVCDKEDNLESVLIPGLDSFTLEFLVNYMYTGSVSGMTMTNMETILNGAETLRLETLKEASGNVLAELMSPGDVIEKWKHATAHKCNESFYISVLQTYATDFVFDNAVQVFETAPFLSLNVKEVERLLHMGTTRDRAPPSTILLAATSWVKHDPEFRQDLLPQLLENVPLEEVPMPYLKTFFREDPLISANLKCQQYYLEFLEKLAMSSDRFLTTRNKPMTSDQTEYQTFGSGLPTPLSARSVMQDVKTSHRMPDCFHLNPVSSIVPKQEIIKLKFKGEGEFRTFSACTGSDDQEHPTHDGYQLLVKRDSETSTHVDVIPCAIQTEVDCLQMNTQLATSSTQRFLSGYESQPGSPQDKPCINGGSQCVLSTNDLSENILATKQNVVSTMPPPLLTDVPHPCCILPPAGNAAESNARTPPSVNENSKSLDSNLPAEFKQSQKSVTTNLSRTPSLKNQLGDETRRCMQKSSKLAIGPPDRSYPAVSREPTRSRSHQPFSSRSTRPQCIKNNEKRRSCKVSSYELKSPSTSCYRMCSTDLSEANPVYGSTQWRPAFPRASCGMMDDNHKHLRAKGSGFTKRARPGKRKSKLLFGRISMNSKLSLQGESSLRSMLDETEPCRAGTPTRVMSRMTSSFRNNRLMFYVEDSAKEERYLMSYDFNTKVRSKLSAYPYAGDGNCFIFHDGSLYDLGGKFRDQADNRVEIFDFDSYQAKKPKWRTRRVPAMALPRYGFQSAVLNDFIYAVGGFHTLGAMNLCERLYIGGGLKNKHWKWDHVATMNRTRAQCSVVAFKGKIYAVGGFSADSDEKIHKMFPTNSVEYYDPKSNEWSWYPGMQTERGGLCAVVLKTRLYALGGGLCRYSEYSGSKLKSVEVYDEEKFEWKYCASMKRARQNFSAVVFKDRIYAIGGDDEKDPTIECYDTIQNSWSIIEHLPSCGNYRTIGFKDSIQSCTESVQSL